MALQSQMSSAVAGGTLPTVPCQDEPASTPRRLVAAMLSRPLGAAQSALLRGASLWAAGCGMHVIWPCGGVRPREMRVEDHGSPMSSIKCALLLCRFRSCDSSAAIPERSSTPLYYPLPSPSSTCSRSRVTLRVDSRWREETAHHHTKTTINEHESCQINDQKVSKEK